MHFNINKFNINFNINTWFTGCYSLTQYMEYVYCFLLFSFFWLHYTKCLIHWLRNLGQVIASTLKVVVFHLLWICYLTVLDDQDLEQVLFDRYEFE